MNAQEKNCAIAALESSLDLIKAETGVSSLSEIETALTDLRTAFNIDPEGTTETAIKQVWDNLKALELDNFYNIIRIWWQLSGYVTQTEGSPDIWFRNNNGALEYSMDDRGSWKGEFPPDEHAHVTADISDFPATMPPEAHEHLIHQITDFPATMPPSAHTHEAADLPATMPPSAHTHSFDALANIPAEFPPEEHTHQILNLLGVEQAFVINCRPISNGTDTQIMTFSGRSDIKIYAPSPPKLGICIRENDMEPVRRCLFLTWIEGDYQPAIYVNETGFGFSPPSHKLGWVSDEIGIYAFNPLEQWFRKSLCTYFWTFFC